MAGPWESFASPEDEGPWSKFGATPGGAATGNPSIQAQGVGASRSTPSATGNLTNTLQTIGGAGAAGGVMGALAPEILTILGAGAAAFPATAPAAPFLFSAGAATRGARTLSAGAGAISGLATETAGQAAEAAGAGPFTAETARFAGGALSGPTLAMGKWAVDVFRSMSSLTMGKKFSKEILNQIANKLEGNPESLSSQERKVLDDLILNLRGGPKSEAPMRKVYSGLESGAAQARVLSQDEANNLISSAERQARTEYDAALTGPVQEIAGKRQRLSQIGAEVVDRAKQQRSTIAPDRELTDIGGDLRGVIVKRNEAALAARTEQYKADEAARNAIVDSKEAAGIHLESLPEYKALLTDLQSKLLNTKTAREAAKGMAPVTEPGVLAGYQRIYDAASRRRIQTGVDAEGAPIYQEFKTSFEALDHLRRKLGDVFRGQPAEGYDAIGAGTARKYYAQISEIQKQFAGGKDGPQAKLLQQYADSTEGLAMFGSKGGQKVTALDKYNDAEFATDASKLPASFLKTRSGIETLNNLTGDPTLVKQRALEYAANQMGKLQSEQQVRTWMTQNREMLSTLPEVRDSVSRYADTLGRAENNVRRVDKWQKILDQRERAAMSDAERAAAATRSLGERQAKEVLQFGEETATRIVGDKSAVARVRELIESGSRKQWESAAPAILGDPQAKAATFDTVRQVVADKAFRSSKGVGQWYSENLRPFIEGNGLVTRDQAESVSARLSNIENLKIPEQEKISLKMRFLLQAIAGYSGSLSSRLSQGVYSGLNSGQ